MIQKASLDFLKNLKKNNSKEWFDANCGKYDAARGDIFADLEIVLQLTGKFDGDIAPLSLKNCTFRINRDVRFAKDKSPYKTNIGAYFARGGKKTDAAGFYIHIEPGASFAAAGCWWPDAKKLAALRQEIDYNFEEWTKVTSSKKFKAAFVDGISKKDSLQRSPKGYDDANPAIEMLKLKSFVTYRHLSDAELQEKDLAKKVAASFETAKPMIDFLNRSD